MHQTDVGNILEDYKRQLSAIHGSAGWLLMQEMSIKPAFGHFNQSDVDSRALIYLVPGLLAPQSTFNPEARDTVQDLGT